jgi:hypothetical protein
MPEGCIDNRDPSTVVAASPPIDGWGFRDARPFCALEKWDRNREVSWRIEKRDDDRRVPKCKELLGPTFNSGYDDSLPGSYCIFIHRDELDTQNFWVSLPVLNTEFGAIAALLYCPL